MVAHRNERNTLSCEAHFSGELPRSGKRGLFAREKAPLRKEIRNSFDYSIVVLAQKRNREKFLKIGAAGLRRQAGCSKLGGKSTILGRELIETSDRAGRPDPAGGR